MATNWKSSPWNNDATFGGGSVTPQFGLAGQANRFMAGQAALPYQMNLPGYQAMIGGESGNILDMIGGEVPDDVINQILQGAAERGIMTGSPGSPNANAAYLKALGLTSLGLQKEGAERLTQAVARTPVPEIWNPMSLYVPQVLGGMELAAARSGMRIGGGGGGYPVFTGGQTITPSALGAEGLAFNRNYNEGVTPGGRLGWFADESPASAASWMDTYGVAPSAAPSAGYSYMGNNDFSLYPTGYGSLYPEEP